MVRYVLELIMLCRSLIDAGQTTTKLDNMDSQTYFSELIQLGRLFMGSMLEKISNG